MAENCREEWYLVRTKSGREQRVRDRLGVMVPEVFLPMLRARTPRWGRLAVSTVPLFPCYLFAKFDLAEHYFDVKYLHGVQSVVAAGNDPLAVPAEIIDGIRSRGENDIVEIAEQPFGAGDRVRVINGPFKGFEAIFQRYLSGAERVAILLSTIQEAGLRVVLPASALTKSS
jgi:transcriptional antiterminator RfaH